MTPPTAAQRTQSDTEVPTPVAVERRGHRYTPPAAGTPTTPRGAYRGAKANVRRHLVRAVSRVVTLVAVDAAGYAAVVAGISWMASDAVPGVGLAGIVGMLGISPIIPLIFALAATRNYAAGDRRRDPFSLVLACALAFAIPLWPQLTANPGQTLSAYLALVGIGALVLATGRFILDALVRRHRPLGPAVARTVIVGPGSVCIDMMSRARFTRDNGFEIVGFVDTDDPPCGTAAPDVDGFEHILDDIDVDTVVLCGHVNEKTFARVLKAAIAAECELLSIPRTFDVGGVRPEVMWRHGHPYVELRAAPLRGQQLILKRALDVVGAAVGIVVLAPLMLVVGAAVRLDSRGPIVFGHRRLGRHGHVFKCYKFRSMHVNAEQILREDKELHAQYLANDFKLPEAIDKRITRVGRVLRRTSLDELPQLWNVLMGHMSLVGPRPIVPAELRHYETEEPLFLSLKPGVTGAWQVQGRSDLPYPGRAAVELEYAQTWSLAKDVNILVRTVPAVLWQRGAH